VPRAITATRERGLYNAFDGELGATIETHVFATTPPRAHYAQVQVALDDAFYVSRASRSTLTILYDAVEVQLNAAPNRDVASDHGSQRRIGIYRNVAPKNA